MNDDHPWDADAIVALRQRHDWTQAELADAIAASLRSVQEWESGRGRPGNRYRRALDRAAAQPRPDAGLSTSQLKALAPRVLPHATDAQVISEIAARFARRGVSHGAPPPIPSGTYRIVTDEAGHVSAVRIDDDAETDETPQTGEVAP